MVTNSRKDFGIKPKRASFRFRAILNISMGLLYFALAGYIITTKSFVTATLTPPLAWGLGALLVVYGLFRAWRGTQDLRASEDPDAEL